jgi:hypothetical protein
VTVSILEAIACHWLEERMDCPGLLGVPRSAIVKPVLLKEGFK